VILTQLLFIYGKPIRMITKTGLLLEPFDSPVGVLSRLVDTDKFSHVPIAGKFVLMLNDKYMFHRR